MFHQIKALDRPLSKIFKAYTLDYFNIIRNIRLIKHSIYFDEEFYLSENQDVRNAGMDAARHYLEHGGYEGRNPSREFMSSLYLHRNPDVLRSGMNPLVHYLKYGNAENRQINYNKPEWREKFRLGLSEKQDTDYLKNHLIQFTPIFLIIAETSIPQCKKYRVDQRLEMFEHLACSCKVVSWHDTSKAHSMLQTASVVIFYRVPAFKEVELLITEAKNLGLSCYFEIDDLIFDKELYCKNLNIKTLDENVAHGLIEGARLYLKTLTACGNTIASTASLAKHMQASGNGESFVIENCLDQETLDIAAGLTRNPSTGITITYGSGTTTHDIDFLEAVPALCQILKENPKVILQIIGLLNLPAELSPYQKQIKILPLSPYPNYLRLLSTSDIFISPLIKNAFNDAKSNIKYLEAAILKIPVVCSPSDTFKRCITHGINGFLADSEHEWYQALSQLIHNKILREETGRAAYRHATENYHFENIAKKQVFPLCKKHTPQGRGTKKILLVNIYFHPNSFGGATIIAEEMMKYLSANAEWEVAVFTSAQLHEINNNEFVRTAYGEVPIFRVGLENSEQHTGLYFNERIHQYFESVLDFYQPNLVHFHSIQGLGTGLTEICQQKKTPFVITLHDFYWLCARQFMIKENGEFCNQELIDPTICKKCITDTSFSLDKIKQIKQTLHAADKLIAPSKFMYDFYIKNGMNENKMFLNKNGVKNPEHLLPNTLQKDRICFGFVAGNETIKGYKLIKQVFENLNSSAWKLLMVDHKSELGGSAIEIKGKGKLEIVPKYTMETIDEYFEKIDVLLFPTQMQEPFGLTVREALIRNKWVITTYAGGVGEAVTDGVNGTLIPLSSDWQYLKKAVESLIDNGEKLDGWSNPLRNEIRLVEEQAEEMAGLYKAILKSGGLQERELDRIQ